MNLSLGRGSIFQGNHARARLRAWPVMATGTKEATNRKPRSCMRLVFLALLAAMGLLAICHFERRGLAKALTSARRFLIVKHGAEACGELRAELEQLRRWHAEYEQEQAAIKAGALSALSESSDVRDLRETVSRKQDEIAELRVQLLESKKALKQALGEKS